jgi:hypothetical protein
VNFKAFNSGNNQVTGSFANSVTVTSSDASTTLSVNGGAASQSVTLTSGTQQLFMNYSGLAVNPVTISASASGATTQNATFSPSISAIVYSGPLNSSNNPEIDLYAPSGTGSQATFTASQAGWTGSTYNNTLIATIPSSGTCSNFATITQPSSTSSSAYTVTAIGSPTVGSCTIGLGGFNSSVTVTITYSTFGVILH